MNAPVLLPVAQRIARQWKNGGGVTHDIALFPPGCDLNDFDWRLSIAEVAQDGAFSHFSGVDRHLAVLEGHLLIESKDGAVKSLAAGDEPISFAGDLPIHGRVIDGPVRDLNLMVRRSAFCGRLKRFARIDRLAAAEATVLVSPGDAMIHIDDMPFRLGRLDAVSIRQNSRMQCDNPLIVAEIASVT